MNFHSVRQWGHLTESHVTEDEYMDAYTKMQTPFMYEERVKEEYGKCNFFQPLNVSILIVKNRLI